MAKRRRLSISAVKVQRDVVMKGPTATRSELSQFTEPRHGGVGSPFGVSDRAQPGGVSRGAAEVQGVG